MEEATYRLFFRAFSNKTRFEIMKVLKFGPKNVTQIIKKTRFEQSRVSHNLRCLEACGFVNLRVKGNQRIYELDKKHILPILKNIEAHIKNYNKRLKFCSVLKNKSCGIIK